MSKICHAGVPPVSFTECDTCVTRYFSYSDYVFSGAQLCFVTRKYRWRNCLLGLALGRHLYSITLLPGEEVELEEVRTHKYSHALHAQNTVEEEIEFEIQEKTREEWSTVTDLNAKYKHSGGAKLFGIGGKSVHDYSVNVKQMEGKVAEIVNKASSSVSKKFEVAISTKTEVENKYRSVRKVRNPNPCQPVTFHYFQVMKKFRRELFLIEQTYDCHIEPMTKEPGLVSFEPDLPRPAHMAPDVVAPPPVWTVEDGHKAPFASACAEADAVQVIEVRFERPIAREMSLEDTLAAIRESGGDESTVAAISQLGDLADPSGGGLIASEEYCVGTDSVFVQAQVSDCMACEETSVRLKELEVRKRELELEKLQCEIELCRKQIDEGGEAPDEAEPDKEPPKHGKGGYGPRADHG